jgi:hypothetical protein
VSGDSQVGYAFNIETGGDRHAMLWHGSAASAVDLNPPGFQNSRAADVSDGIQVGFGFSSTAVHALLWHGTAASAVDLNPSGFTTSIANGVAGDLQVGSASGPTAPNHGHAMLWSGAATSAVDLHLFLSGLGPKFTESEAEDIADNGSIVGHAAEANGRVYAVLWTPVPEPSSLALTIGAAVMVCTLMRSRQFRSPVRR